MNQKPHAKAPSRYSDALAERICDRVAEGETLRSICRDLGLLWQTVFRWLDAHPKFAERYRRARDLGMDAIAEETLEIADSPSMGVIETEKADGSIESRREDMLGHRKLQIDTRLKLLAKWNPKKYGERITHAGDPDAPLPLVLNGSDVHG